MGTIVLDAILGLVMAYYREVHAGEDTCARCGYDRRNQSKLVVPERVPYDIARYRDEPNIEEQEGA